ncbi:hypothetical protein MSPP1_002118 [Malassezia sp. CBS 17886]|nr:hypothetical protein MSPP1_002118 [Malassezia sp. CBS 17886]
MLCEQGALVNENENEQDARVHEDARVSGEHDSGENSERARARGPSAAPHAQDAAPDGRAASPDGHVMHPAVPPDMDTPAAHNGPARPGVPPYRPPSRPSSPSAPHPGRPSDPPPNGDPALPRVERVEAHIGAWNDLAHDPSTADGSHQYMLSQETTLLWPPLAIGDDGDETPLPCVVCDEDTDHSFEIRPPPPDDLCVLLNAILERRAREAPRGKDKARISSGPAGPLHNDRACRLVPLDEDDAETGDGTHGRWNDLSMARTDVSAAPRHASERDAERGSPSVSQNPLLSSAPPCSEEGTDDDRRTSASGAGGSGRAPARRPPPLMNITRPCLLREPAMTPRDPSLPVYADRLPDELWMLILSFVVEPRAFPPANLTRVLGVTYKQPEEKWAETTGPDYVSLENLGRTCLRMRMLSARGCLWRQVVQAAFLHEPYLDGPPLQYLLDLHGSWRNVFLYQPRVKLNGLYAAPCYCALAGPPPRAAVGSVIGGMRLIKVYRYLRFFPMGLCLSMLSTNTISEIENILVPGVQHPSVTCGEWACLPEVGPPGAKRTRCLTSYVVLSGLREPSMHHHAFRMTLALYQSNAGHWDYMEVKSYTAYNHLTGEVVPYPTKLGRPFTFSRVVTYGV